MFNAKLNKYLQNVPKESVLNRLRWITTLSDDVKKMKILKKMKKTGHKPVSIHILPFSQNPYSRKTFKMTLYEYMYLSIREAIGEKQSETFLISK